MKDCVGWRWMESRQTKEIVKVIFIAILLLFNIFSVFSQQDLIKELTKQAVIIDSLERVLKTEKIKPVTESEEDVFV